MATIHDIRAPDGPDWLDGVSGYLRLSDMAVRLEFSGLMFTFHIFTFEEYPGNQLFKTCLRC